MKFTYRVNTRSWVSACGNYEIWIQAHPRHEPAYWAAQFRDEKPWLTNNDTKPGAKKACAVHALNNPTARIVLAPR